MDSIYSNFDHKLNADAINWLVTHTGQELTHSAWNFCSYIRFEDGKFKARVMRYQYLVAELENNDVAELIKETNEQFGYE